MESVTFVGLLLPAPMPDFPLDNFLLRFHLFTPQQLQLIRNCAVARTYPSGAYFSEAGQVAQEIGFIVTGLFRVCYFDREGTDNTKYFIEENHFVVDLQSYQYQQPCTEYVQAVTETHVLVFPARAWQELGLTIVAWPQIEQKLFTQALLEKLNRRSAGQPQRSRALRAVSGHVSGFGKSHPPHVLGLLYWRHAAVAESYPAQPRPAARRAPRRISPTSYLLIYRKVSRASSGSETFASCVTTSHNA